MDHLKITDAIHEFMRANTTLDDKGLATLARMAQSSTPQPGVNWPTFMLSSAVTYSHVDAAKVLVEEYGADVQFTTGGFVDRKKGSITQNFLHQALNSYLDRPDVDRSAAGQQRLADTVEYLLQKGVPASPNPDPMDNPARLAARLVDASKSYDPKSREYDYLADAFDSAARRREAPFEKPYELIGEYAPEAVKSFEAASGKAGLLAQVASDIKLGLANLKR